LLKGDRLAYALVKLVMLLILTLWFPFRLGLVLNVYNYRLLKRRKLKQTRITLILHLAQGNTPAGQIIRILPFLIVSNRRIYVLLCIINSTKAPICLQTCNFDIDVRFSVVVHRPLGSL